MVRRYLYPMVPSSNDIDTASALLMEMLYTALSQERPSWYRPDPERWRASLEQEVLHIEQLWLRFDFATVDPQLRTRTIQRQQLVLLHCLHWLEQAGESVARDEARSAIDRLLDFLLAHFEAALRKDLLTPRLQQLRVVSQLKVDLPALQAKLEAASAGAQLKQLVVEQFISFIERAPGSAYFYGQVLMMQALMQFLLESRLTPSKIIYQLCYLNGNSHAVYRYLKKYFDRSPLTFAQKTHRYGRLSKYFKRLPVKKGSFMEAQQQPLTLQLADYFADLARDAERNLQLQAKEVPALPYQDRLAFRLTVEQLGLYLRLFKAADILQPVPTTHIIRFCIKYLRTVAKDAGGEISYEYLKSTITRQSMEAFTVVEKQLGEMMVLLRKWRIEMRKTK